MNLAQAQAAIQAQQQRLAGQTLYFRPPPPEPNSCCGRGCQGCVWSGYFEALAFWLEDAENLIQ